MVQKNPSATETRLAPREEVRRRARRRIEEGAVSEGFGADREEVLALLDEALATELVCVLRYKRHSFTAKGAASGAVARELAEHAADEQEHADRIAERIVELRGEPDMDPRRIAERAASEYAEGATLAGMMREDLVNERIAIESYARMIRAIGAGDPTTRRLLEEILAKEEEHATDLVDLLDLRAAVRKPRLRGFLTRRLCACSICGGSAPAIPREEQILTAPLRAGPRM